MTSYLQNKQLTVALSGELDHHHAKQIMQALREKIDEFLPRSCILDFRDVTFMDSSGIAVVICGHRQMRTIGGKLVLANVPPQPAKVFRAAGIERVAEITGGVTV